MEHAPTKAKPAARRRRSERLFVTLTEREKAAILLAATLDGIGPTEWARVCLLEQAERRARQTKRAKRLLTILAPDADPSDAPLVPPWGLP